MRARVVREARLDDVNPVVGLVNAAYREGGERAWTTESHLVGGPRVTPDELRAILASPAEAVLVAAEADRIVGCVHLRGLGEECLLGMLSVDPREQASGVGRALLEAGEAHARDRLGARLVVMDVISVRGELLAWYERRGYQRTGRLQPFVEEGNVRFLQGPLLFERLEKRVA